MIRIPITISKGIIVSCVSLISIFYGASMFFAVAAALAVLACLKMSATISRIEESHEQ